MEFEVIDKTNHAFCIHQILDKNGSINFMILQDSLVGGSIATEFGVLMKVGRLIKICLIKIYNKMCKS
jgi:hypothetical protein